MPDTASLILCVDDNEAARYALTRVLQRAGFRTVEASTGTEALEKMAERPDLVVLDVRLPDIDGFAVCQRIKSDPRTASTPVLQISADLVEVADRTRGLELGADAYLTQPLGPPELIATIRALLRARRAEEQARGIAREPPERKRLLLVEDSPDIGETLRDLLQLLGHRVELAADGLRGVQLALTSRPDAALVDIGLPGIDGYQVARRLRATDTGRQILLVALTGYGRPEDRERSLEAGFDAHLVKPVDPDDLNALLASLAGSRKAAGQA